MVSAECVVAVASGIGVVVAAAVANEVGVAVAAAVVQTVAFVFAALAAASSPAVAVAVTVEIGAAGFPPRGSYHCWIPATHLFHSKCDS